MTPIHVFYGSQSAPLFRRMAGEFPFGGPSACLDEDYTSNDGWLVLCEPNPSPLNTKIPYGRRGICVNEPAVMNALPVSYLNQFGLLISPFRMAGYVVRGIKRTPVCRGFLEPRWRENH